MKPLVFLAFKTFINGIKRALGSAKRLIGILFIAGYWLYYGVFAGSISRMSTGGTPVYPPLHLSYPVGQVIDAVLFAVFVVLSWPFLSMVSNYNQVMRPADVDVLFPTPVNPKLVMVFRIARDFFGWLVLPVFFLVFSRRYIPINELTGVVGRPGAGWELGRSWALAWVLLALAWTSIGYSATLFVNRSDLASSRNKKILSMIILVAVFGTIGYVGWTFYKEFSVPSALGIAANPVLRVVYLPATLATALAVAPVGNGWMSLGAALGLLAIAAVFLQIAFSQAGWMYDQAAVKGFETLESRALAKSGNVAGLLALRARTGKLKAGRKTWIHKLKMAGANSLIWRDLLLQRRTMQSSFAIFTIISVFYSLFPVIIAGQFHGGRKVGELTGWMILLFQGLGVFMGTMSVTQTGFSEFLRRLDLLKPLPFSAQVLVLFEIMGKAIVPIAVNLISTLVALAIAPNLWTYFVASMLLMPSVALTIITSSLVILLLFPDIDDPTQRSFRGLMQMLALALTVAPGLGVFVVANFLMHQILVAAALAVLCNVLITAGLSYLSGNLYLDYNPTD